MILEKGNPHVWNVQLGSWRDNRFWDKFGHSSQNVHLGKSWKIAICGLSVEKEREYFCSDSRQRTHAWNKNEISNRYRNGTTDLG